MSNRPKADGPIKIFFSYAHQDEKLRDQLAKHLSPLSHLKIIENWHDGQISAGTEWQKQIKANLDAANIILLLISSDFLSSDFCYDIEMKRALQRQESGESQVIPIILRPCAWEDTPLVNLQALPPKGKPVTSWRNRDEAFETIVEGIQKVISEQAMLVPVAPSKIRRLWGWIIEDKQWPLLLSFIIPLYFVVGGDLNERTLLILAGITSLTIGMFYWAIRRQVRRLWPGGSLGIIGAGLIMFALALPVCSLLRLGSNNAKKLTVTIARFRPDDSTPRSDARRFNNKFQAELSKQQALFTIKTYNAEVEDGEQEKIDAQLGSSNSCDCQIFVSGVFRRASDNEESEEADINLRMATSQASSDSQERTGAKSIEPKNILVKNQKSYSSLVKLLVAYAYYKWGDWDNAIDILKEIRAVEMKQLRGESYFYEGLCRLNKGLAASDKNIKIDELMTARDNFDDASRFADGSVSLDAASQLNLAYTRIALSGDLPVDKAVKELNSAIAGLEKLREREKEDNHVLATIGDCDPTRANLVLAYVRMHAIDDKSEWLVRAQEIITDFNANCPEEKAISKVNTATLLANIGRRSNNGVEFETRYGQALNYYKEAFEYFDSLPKDSKKSYFQDWVTTANNWANKLNDLGTYRGSEGRDYFEQAKKLYENVLGFLSKDENFDDWAWTKSNLAATLIKLGNLDGADEKDYDAAINVCQEVIKAYGQSPDRHWLSARCSQATAQCLLGIRRGNQGLLQNALEACEELSRKLGPNTIEWALNEKTWGDAYFHLSLLSQDSQGGNLRKAQSKYENARRLFCDYNDMILQKVRSEVESSILMTGRPIKSSCQ